MQQQNQHEANGSERCELLPVPAPPSEIALKCPRCESTNTKFCYFNNYSLSQPRHFCKTCRRYWTRGGALRNVPVGGGYRRNKKTKRTTNSKSPLPNDKESVLSGSSFINSSSHDQFGHFTHPTNRPNYMNSLIQNQIQSRYGSRDLDQMGVHEGAGVMDQWRFPFFNGFESTSSAVSYPFQSEIVEATTSRVTQQPSVKLEYNIGGINLSRSTMLSNNHYNSWGTTTTELSAFASSSASHL